MNMPTNTEILQDFLPISPNFAKMGKDGVVPPIVFYVQHKGVIQKLRTKIYSGLIN